MPACVMVAGCAIRLSTPPSDSASVKHCEPGEKRLDRRLAARKLEAQHRAEAALLAPRDLMPGMIGQTGVVHPLAPPDARVRKSTTAAVFSACTRMRACRVRTPRSVRKLSNGAPVTPMALAHHARFSLQLGGRRDHRAADDVAVTIQVLGGGMHDHVGAERQRLLPDRRQKGVVDHRPARPRRGPRRRSRGCRPPAAEDCSASRSRPVARLAASAARKRSGIALIDEVDHEIVPAHATRPAGDRCRRSNHRAR